MAGRLPGRCRPATALSGEATRPRRCSCCCPTCLRLKRPRAAACTRVAAAVRDDGAFCSDGRLDGGCCCSCSCCCCSCCCCCCCCCGGGGGGGCVLVASRSAAVHKWPLSIWRLANVERIARPRCTACSRVAAAACRWRSFSDPPVAGHRVAAGEPAPAIGEPDMPPVGPRDCLAVLRSWTGERGSIECALKAAVRERSSSGLSSGVAADVLLGGLKEFLRPCTLPAPVRFG